MLTLSKSQVRAFSEAARRRFEDGMVKHLGMFSPPLSMTVGEEQLKKIVHLGITRASIYGLTHQGPVRLYLESMLLFGSHFDTDPQYSWAAQILINHKADPQMQRAERLYERTLDYQARVDGPKPDYASAVLRDIRFLSMIPLSLSTARNFIPDMLSEITQAYSQKAAYVGWEGLEALIRQGIGVAESHRLTSARGMALIIALMLILGHGFIDDALYPWVAQTLNDTTPREPMARARHLETKALAWLDRMLAHQIKGAQS